MEDIRCILSLGINIRNKTMDENAFINGSYNRGTSESLVKTKQGSGTKN